MPETDHGFIKGSIILAIGAIVAAFIGVLGNAIINTYKNSNETPANNQNSIIKTIPSPLNEIPSPSPSPSLNLANTAPSPTNSPVTNTNAQNKGTIVAPKKTPVTKPKQKAAPVEEVQEDICWTTDEETGKKTYVPCPEEEP